MKLMYLSNNVEVLAKSAMPSQFSIKLIDSVYATPAQPKLTMHMREMTIQAKWTMYRTIGTFHQAVANIPRVPTIVEDSITP